MGWQVSSNAMLHLKILTRKTSSTPFPLIDGVGRIIGVLAGQPGSGYAAELDDAFEEMMREGEGAGLGATSSEGAGARGWFPAFNCGVSMGMGNSHPVQLDPKHMKDVLERLVGSKSVRRMAMYQNAAFSLWAPRVYEVYERTTNTMWEKMPGLQNNFPGGVFGAAAFNFGGSVWTFKHRDFQNWPFGWCAITALGKFDPTRSAQLILWELKLVIDFPHASTILIPSAVITHSNTPVADGDIRTSFTQYTAGAIFRWVENGCLTEEKLEKSDPTRYRQMMRDKSTAVSRRLELYSTVDELLCKID
ncbi:hypothetical protein BDP27DRAFT_1241394 [Rhodocollybia butyracea]|uniref:Uncharacterized protein n=1 Tax=Rhodocollybia butyracea TaxID=206335 RepID=A0A9P5P7N9_9AGAR|nr:hypothetical protein BDP27DRAFT_1241394 [Rhodocollybia butyracea]